METGQLNMQISARSMTDFAGMAAVPSAMVVKKDSASFDGMLREVTPQRYSRTEQTARTEAKRVTSKKPEMAEEPVKQQTTSKSVDSAGQSDSRIDKSNQKSPAVVDETKQENKMDKADMPIPQNAEMMVAAAQLVVAQQLPEDRMSKTADSENNLKMSIDQIEAQNATDIQISPTNTDGKLMTGTAGTLQNAVQQLGSSAESAEPKSQDVALPQVSPVTTAPVQQDKALKAQFVEVEKAGAEKTSSQSKPAPVIDSESNESDNLRKMEVSSAGIQKAAEDDAQPEKKFDNPGLKVETVAKVANGLKVETAAKFSNASSDVLSSSAALQTGAQLQPQVEKVPSQPFASEFRFARSSAVDLAITVVNQAADQPRVSSEGPAAIETGATANTKMPEVSQGSFKGSDSSSNGNGQEGFSQQNLDLPKPAMPQTANISLAATSNVLSANGSTVQAAPQELNRTAGSESIVGQVREQLSTRNIKQGNEQITIQLSPDHLGDIKVSFRLEDQKLRVEIVAENRTARESLLQHADSLKESLARQNINMEKFEVTGGNSGSTTGQGAYSQPEWREMAKNRQSQQWLTSGGYRTQTLDTAAQAPVYFARSEHSTLDLHF